MEKFIKMTVSYIDSIRGLHIRRRCEDVHYRWTCYSLRYCGECGIWGYLLDFIGDINNKDTNTGVLITFGLFNTNC